MARVKTRGKSPRSGAATRNEVPLTGCKTMYTDIQGLSVRCRGVGREDKWRRARLKSALQDPAYNSRYLFFRVMVIDDYNYALPDERIAKFPRERREDAKLLVWRGAGSQKSSGGEIGEQKFGEIGELLPEGGLVVMNDTRVVRARIVMHKPGGGARIEVFCLEPHEPADYERAFAAVGECSWRCLVGNSKKWKSGAIEAGGLRAYRVMRSLDSLHSLRDDREDTLRDGGARADVVRFEWGSGQTFGQILEELGRVPIPPYLNRESTEVDSERYQTVYSRIEGSVAAPTAGLHFTPEILAGLNTDRVTLHVGAGTFLPVKASDPRDHVMHTECFEFSRGLLDNLLRHKGRVTAVGTTTVRTLESLAALGWRIIQTSDPSPEREVGQWELYDIPPDAPVLETLRDYMLSRDLRSIKAATRIMIMPGYNFRIVNNLITNFHQPKSTLLLLVSAFTGGRWREIYDYALGHDFRFLSYGDSSFLMRSQVAP